MDIVCALSGRHFSTLEAYEECAEKHCRVDKYCYWATEEWEERIVPKRKPSVSPEQWEKIVRAMRDAGINDKKEHWWELW